MIGYIFGVGRVLYHWIYPLLVGGLEHDFFFHSVGNVIIPTDEVTYFSEG